MLGVLYLLFNEGYSATTGGDLVRDGLCDEAIRLARVLAELMPDEPEVSGLLSLMVLHHARRAARVDDTGALVPLAEQDRTRWDGDAIAGAIELLDAALRRGEPGPYQVQAAIAACHCTAAEAADTDWAEIAQLYERLSHMLPTPVVALNRAVAVAMADGPAAGLALVEELEASGALAGYHLLPATRADLLRRLGRRAEAAGAYRRARTSAVNSPPSPVSPTPSERARSTSSAAQSRMAGSSPTSGTRQEPVAQVDVPAPRAHQFAPPQTGSRRHEHQRPIPRLDRSGDGVHLLNRDRRSLRGEAV